MSQSSCIDVPPSSTGRCAFCDYLAGKRPYSIVHRTPQVAVLVTREQRGVPHLLVMPAQHCETILDLPDDVAAELMRYIKYAAFAIDRAYCRRGIAIWQNNGLDADQTIAHLHFHVAGTLDGGGTKRDDVPELSVGETDVIAERLRPLVAQKWSQKISV